MEEGTIVFYIDDHRVYCGRVTDVEIKGEGCLFSIEGYGNCEGACRISSDQIGRTVFFSEEDAEERAEFI